MQKTTQIRTWSPKRPGYWDAATEQNTATEHGVVFVTLAKLMRCSLLLFRTSRHASGQSINSFLFETISPLMIVPAGDITATTCLDLRFCKLGSISATSCEGRSSWYTQRSPVSKNGFQSIPECNHNNNTKHYCIFKPHNSKMEVNFKNLSIEGLRNLWVLLLLHIQHHETVP